MLFLYAFVVIAACLALSLWKVCFAKKARKELEAAQQVTNEQKQLICCLEQQVLDIQNQEHVSSLVGGIVHEFNNSLTSVVAQSEMGIYYDSSEEKNAAFQQVVQVALQAAELAGQLLKYSVRDSFSFGTVDLNQVVTSVQRLMSATIRDRVNLTVQLTELDVSVRANEVQLQQAIVCLVNRSIETLDDSKNIGLTTGCRQLDEDQVKQASNGQQSSPGDYCFVKVSDNGVGTDENSIRRLFGEPMSSGQSSGMASVFAIVRSCHGLIDVRSAPETGTSITLFLPKLPEEVDDLDKSSFDFGMNRPISVLFVDDDPLIRESAKRILESSDFDVLMASNPDEAMQVAGSQANRIDCMVIDYLLPPKNGVWLAKKLKHKNPKTPMILSSGFARSSVFDPHLFDRFLAKPYFPNQLVESIKKTARASDG